jgi:hypothetical protein
MRSSSKGSALCLSTVELDVDSASESEGRPGCSMDQHGVHWQASPHRTVGELDPWQVASQELVPQRNIVSEHALRSASQMRVHGPVPQWTCAPRQALAPPHLVPHM